MKYRDNLPLALKSVSFDVLPQEKVGIVGRSGSGRSFFFSKSKRNAART